MLNKTVLSLFSSADKLTLMEISDQIDKSINYVTAGRYLIAVFDAPVDWNSRVPIESLLITKTLGNIENRNNHWEFFGNGCIRCYGGKTNKLKRTLQWIILKREGEKPYKRRGELSGAFIKKNIIPVGDPVFTRDVANNVWNLRVENLKERLVARFAALLSWQDEGFYVLEGSKITEIKNRKKLQLTEDLVGVPFKSPYIWNSGDTIF
jgi:hypothetical protein